MVDFAVPLLRFLFGWLVAVTLIVRLSGLDTGVLQGVAWIDMVKNREAGSAWTALVEAVSGKALCDRCRKILQAKSDAKLHDDLSFEKEKIPTLTASVAAVDFPAHSSPFALTERGDPLRVVVPYFRPPIS